MGVIPAECYWFSKEQSLITPKAEGKVVVVVFNVYMIMSLCRQTLVVWIVGESRHYIHAHKDMKERLK